MSIRKANQLDLLEYLSYKAGCAYLSDLPQPQYLPLIQHTLRGIAPKLFSLKEWNDAAVYITRRDVSFETEEQAQQFLLGYAPV